MSGVVIVGAQWGDEGKGKMTDYLARQADVVVRYQGGNNAGHTVVIGTQEYRLHLIPSGIFYPDKVCIIGNGLVVDPESLLEELDTLLKQGVKPSRLYISDRAHVLLPYHKRLDGIEEESRGSRQIGTTKRGIGPCYADKVARTGLRMGDLLEPDWEAQLKGLVSDKNRILQKFYGVEGFDPAETVAWMSSIAARLHPYIADTSLIIAYAAQAGKQILYEGAQGTLLDLDHGTFPFVTSSSPTAGGACTGAGVGPTAIDVVLGVCKAYTTRVGEGPFPTEEFGELGDQLRESGAEFGTTTGRPRRCGWLDLVIMRYTARVNGLSGLLITKLDVLDKLPVLKICNTYSYQGRILKDFPASLRVLEGCEPVYEEMPGWQQETTGVKTYDDLPINARAYIQRISEITGVPVTMVSVGPDRNQTLVLSKVFK
jgi:adenylosuccinate synthase